MVMQPESAHKAVRIVGLALDEVQRFGGLPIYDETFLELVKHIAQEETQEADLVAVIDAISPLFPGYQFRWK